MRGPRAAIRHVYNSAVNFVPGRNGTPKKPFCPDDLMEGAGLA